MGKVKSHINLLGLLEINNESRCWIFFWTATLKQLLFLTVGGSVHHLLFFFLFSMYFGLWQNWSLGILQSLTLISSYNVAISMNRRFLELNKEQLNILIPVKVLVWALLLRRKTRPLLWRWSVSLIPSKTWREGDTFFCYSAWLITNMFLPMTC